MLSGLPISSVPCFRRAGDHEEARPSALRQRHELVAKFLYFRFPAKKEAIVLGLEGEQSAERSKHHRAGIVALLLRGIQLQARPVKLAEL